MSIWLFSQSTVHQRFVSCLNAPRWTPEPGTKRRLLRVVQVRGLTTALVFSFRAWDMLLWFWFFFGESGATLLEFFKMVLLGDFSLFHLFLVLFSTANYVPFFDIKNNCSQHRDRSPRRLTRWKLGHWHIIQPSLAFVPAEMSEEFLALWVSEGVCWRGIELRWTKSIWKADGYHTKTFVSQMDVYINQVLVEFPQSDISYICISTCHPPTSPPNGHDTPPVVGVCCEEGGTRCSKSWQNIINVLKDKFPLPPVVGVCCVDGWDNSICLSICCICICYMCGCICKCKCVCISISTLSCTCIRCL